MAGDRVASIASIAVHVGVDIPRGCTAQRFAAWSNVLLPSLPMQSHQSSRNPEEQPILGSVQLQARMEKTLKENVHRFCDTSNVRSSVALGSQ